MEETSQLRGVLVSKILFGKGSGAWEIVPNWFGDQASINMSQHLTSIKNRICRRVLMI